MAAIATKLGMPFMPWQRLVADVGGELDPETGLPAYRGVCVTVPRQSGKTTLVLSWEIQRCIGWGSIQRVAYSAQSGLDARKKLIEDQVPLLEPRRRALKISRILRGIGSEAVEFTNGSRIVLLASTADSGHGKTIDLAIKDELFADTDFRRDQAVIPAMATRPAGQVVTTSTMGTEESVPLNQLVERGRAAAAAGERTGLAYFEWSAEEGCDPDDPAVWWTCMPALGITITESVVRDARNSMTEGDFRRAFLNQSTVTDQRIVSYPAWEAVVDEKAGADGPFCFGLEMSSDRATASMAVAGSNDTVEIVGRTEDSTEPCESTTEAIDRAAELSSKWGNAPFFVDGGGPAASLVPALVDKGVPVTVLTTKQFVEATAGIYDAIIEQRITVRRHSRMDAAIAAATKRTVRDAWAWARPSSADVAPLIAATAAHWGAAQMTEPEPRARWL